RCIELRLWFGVGAAGPLRAETARESLSGGITGAREGPYAPPPVASHLDDDMSGRAEAEQPETLPLPREPQRAVSDEPGAEQRRDLDVVEAGRKRETEARVGDGQLR